MATHPDQDPPLSLRAIMRLAIGVTLSIGLLFAAGAAQARPRPLDCPLRDAPFTVGTPLIDIMLSEPARATVERMVPGLLDGLPPGMKRTEAPSFGAIIALRDAFLIAGQNASLIETLDRALRAVRVTPADRVARCRRYDDTRPPLCLSGGRPAILLFEKITGFRDGPSVDAAHRMIVAIAAKRDWQIVVSEQAGVMNPRDLARFEVVVWNNVSGDVLTLSQRRAFRAYVEKGGAYVGLHGSAGDPVVFWRWYADTLIGTRFAGHSLDREFQDARIVVDDRDHPVSRGLPSVWTMNDEWYSFVVNPRSSGARVVATLDEGSYDPGHAFGRDLRMGDHPIAWTRRVGKGRMFYSAIGHRPESYLLPEHITLIENALRWASAR